MQFESENFGAKEIFIFYSTSNQRRFWRRMTGKEINHSTDQQNAKRFLILLYLENCGHERWLRHERSLSIIEDKIFSWDKLKTTKTKSNANIHFTISKDFKRTKAQICNIFFPCKEYFLKLKITFQPFPAYKLTFWDSFWMFSKGSEDLLRKSRSLFSRTGGGLPWFFLWGDACCWYSSLWKILDRAERIAWDDK